MGKPKWNGALQFSDIPQFPRAAYEIDVEWGYLENWLKSQEDIGINLDPDFQRAHVWTKEQQIAYIEYCLQGGELSRTIIFNCTFWHSLDPKPGDSFDIIDGKQRMEAVRKFLRDEIPVFGDNVYSKMGRLRYIDGRFKIRICSLKTRADVLSFYLSLNSGGTQHTPSEIERVRKLLEKETQNA